MKSPTNFAVANNMAPKAYRNHCDFAHISCVVSNFNDHVLSWGLNGFDLKGRSIHSEEVAWSKFLSLLHHKCIPSRWLRRGVRLVNMALSPTFKLRMCRPCRRCSLLIEKYSHLITDVMWTDAQGECHISPSSNIVYGSQWSRGDRKQGFRHA